MTLTWGCIRPLLCVRRVWCFDFRAEAFNVLNQTNFAFPASETYSPTSTSFGVATSATTQPARVLQFAGKIIF